MMILHQAVLTTRVNLKPANVRFLAFAMNRSYEQAALLYLSGRLSTRAWERYCRIWDWACPRHSGTAGHEQFHWIKRYGEVAYKQRMNRLRRVCGLELIP